MVDKQRGKPLREVETIRQLELENQLLSERAEEIFLLGKIAEQASAAKNIRGLLRQGLEQIAIIKDIAFAAYGAWREDGLDLAYGILLQGEDMEGTAVALAPEVLAEAREKMIMLNGEACAGVVLPPEVQATVNPSAITLIPAWSREGSPGCFIFANQCTSIEQQERCLLVARAVELLSFRMDNLTLVSDLDAKVVTRTKQLERANTELQTKVQELEKAQQELQVREQRYRALVQNGFDALFVFDFELNIIDVNNIACSYLGYTRDELTQMYLADLVRDLDIEAGRKTILAIEPSQVRDISGTLQRKDGTEFPVETRLGHFESGQQKLFLAVVRDVSEKSALEHQLHQAQKMEVLGQLSGGVAHDFNNILTVVAGHVDLAAMTLAADNPLLKDLQAIKAAGERGSRLTRQLLSFSRRQVFKMEPLDLNESVHDLVKVIGRVIGEDIQLALDLASDIGGIMADKGSIEQVLMNLVLNARDAMPAGGKISLQTSRVTDGEIFKPDELQEKSYTGHYLKLKVSDEGQGISQEALSHIFDPFFTTKEAGKGTGLGLAMVYNICNRHQGWIEVDSIIGQGTVFELFFPEIARASIPYGQGSREKLPRGDESLLLVEDDAAIREVMTRMLERLGYDLQVAENGVEALKLIQDSDRNFALMISDVVMPRMGGGQLAAEAKRLQPDMKILFMSGYTGDMIGEGTELAQAAGFLQKPVSYSELATTLRSIIDE